MNIMNKVTLKGLLKNKTRTIVTIIGVILSASMITAVTTFISSLQNYAVNYAVATEGDWHAVEYNRDYKDYEYLKSTNEFDNIALTRDIGYVNMEEVINAYKPYYHITEFDANAFEMLPIILKSGRIPQNDKEIIISEHAYTNGGAKYKVGDTISLEIGQRVLEDGSVLTQNDPYQLVENEVLEQLDISDTRTYTIVGICKRLSNRIEVYSAPGYSLITLMNQNDIKESDSLSIYMKALKPGEIYKLTDRFEKQNNFTEFKYNDELLRFLGYSNMDSFNSVLYGLAAILICLIMVGSISLIYNSFAISVSERKKQFGLLSGAGATTKQLRNSVFFESFLIASIGIPIGVVSGIVGIGTTLYLLKKQMTSILTPDLPLTLDLYVSIPSIIGAVLVALATILLSAYIPARGCRKISAMDAIRQTADIRLTAKQIKTSKFTRKLYGLEGELALKNLKRNRRRYRSTVISLFISVILFVSASSFSTYLKDSVMNVYENTNYDITYYANEDWKTKEDSLVKTYENIRAIDGIEQGAIIGSLYGTVNLTKKQVVKSYYEEMLSRGLMPEQEDMPITLQVQTVDHETFLSYLKELGLEREPFLNSKVPTGIIIDKQHYYNMKEERYNNTTILNQDNVNTLTMEYNTEKDINTKVNIQIGAYANKPLFGLQDYYNWNTISVIMDDSICKDIFIEHPEYNSSKTMFFKAKDPLKAEEQMKDILIADGRNNAYLFNVARQVQNNRNVIMIISVFSYGFIILMSLITIANVFNTISTNVNLRRREFAMLKSVGMTSRGFNKMLNYECIFYGMKALLYGIPVSIGVTYLIYRSIIQGVDIPFYIPMNSIIISSFSVFLVVFISMMYSMSKIRKENILDALKNENL